MRSLVTKNSVVSLLFFAVSSVPLWLGAAERLEAQAEPTAHGQAWEVHVDSGRISVGDTVGLTFRIRLDERDLLFDTLPRPVDSAFDGVRIVSVERLHRLANRDFVGRAVLAFYRTGPQPVPVFALPFMRAVKGITSGVIRSDTLSVEVVPVLAAGNPTLRDIRELDRSSVPRLIAGVVIVLALAVVVLILRRRRKPLPPAPAVVAEPETFPALPPPNRTKSRSRGWARSSARSGPSEETSRVTSRQSPMHCATISRPPRMFRPVNARRPSCCGLFRLTSSRGHCGSATSLSSTKQTW